VVYRVLVGKPERKRPLGRPRRRWEDNIKMDLQEVGGGCEDWMELAQDNDRWRALVSTVMNLRVPKMRGISSLAAEPVTFSRRTLLRGVSKYISSHYTSCVTTKHGKFGWQQIWKYRGADKSLARPGKKQATTTEHFEFHISYL